MRIRSLVLAVAVFTFTICADNWPEWRGPTRDGVTKEKNVPVKWSATENIKWKTPLPDRGNSTPIVWGNRIFVTQAVEKNGSRNLMCFDRKDGKLLWEKGVVWAEKEKSHETNPQCSPSPATDGERVVAWFGSAGLHCYDLDGKELWKRDLGRQEHEWGYASSPIIFKDQIFLNFGPGTNSAVMAFDKKTGKTAWQVPVTERHYKERNDGFKGQGTGYTGSFSTPIVIHTDNGDEVIVSLPDKIQALNPATGKEIWSCQGMNPLIYTSTVFGEGVIVASGGFTGPDIAVKPGGKGDVTTTHKLWEGERTQNRLGSCVIKEGYAFFNSMPGIVECRELKTGKKVWDQRLREKGAKADTWSSLVLAGDNIYLLNQAGETVIFKARPQFEFVGINLLPDEHTNSSPVVSDGDIFIRTDENLYCIGQTTQTASRF